MKRLMTVVAAVSLVTAACGGGDDPSSEPADAPSEATTDDSSADDASSSADESTDTADADATTEDLSDTDDSDTDPGGTADDTDVSDTDDSAADADTGDDSPSGPEIRSISDVPQVCQDAMARFLQSIEPIVKPIDWQNATMADFEQIARDFESKSDEFENAIGDAGCDDMNFVDDSEGQILIEFARDQAPDAVGFLEFLDQMRTGAFTGDDAVDTAGIETCQDAIDFLQNLVDTYDSIEMVPATELMKIPSIASLYADCTVEQLEFFDNTELADFMGGG